MKKDKDNNTPKRRSTFAILFYINRTKVRKDGTCQLLCKVSIDAEWEQIGTKVSVNPDIWNPEKGRADGRSANAVTVNRAIDSLTAEINEHYEDIRRSLGFVTAELVKNAMKGIGRKPSTLLALFREHNEEFHKRVGVDRTKESYESYLNSYRHLSAFVTGKRDMDDVPLRALDRSFYDDFEVFLGADRGLKPKSVHEHLYRLKKMTMRAVSQGTLRRDPYARLHPPLPRRKSRHMRLDDLKLLMEKQIDAPNLQRVRDWFIFSTFTGLAYADLKQLTEDDISQTPDGTWWIHVNRQKTDSRSAIRLLDIPMRIMEKYRDERQDGKIFNLYSRTYLIKLTRQLGKEYGFCLTFHKARHNFGTHITLSMGVPIETVSRMMGHKSVTTTQIYAQVTDRKVDEDMKRLRMQASSAEITLIDESMDKEMAKRRKYKFRNKTGNGL
ncbi:MULTISPECIES: site-specific integrase [Muribaculaceae]|jgi:site-specific recombinase XerD|uniref:site-specific integrase n=1 Tax=Muribaculaceae TaxID=2005473 RepID=UPI0025B34DA7|nr:MULTISPECIES: site-specific integrase [Muribaculaceae]